MLLSHQLAHLTDRVLFGQEYLVIFPAPQPTVVVGKPDAVMQLYAGINVPIPCNQMHIDQTKFESRPGNGHM